MTFLMGSRGSLAKIPGHSTEWRAFTLHVQQLQRNSRLLRKSQYVCLFHKVNFLKDKHN
jgi:mannose/cellobiose epimerase-like protein (N-acyl-D-glucosamine 2-epimerase family)